MDEPAKADRLEKDKEEKVMAAAKKQRAWEERNEKEKATRLQWFRKNYDKLVADAERMEKEAAKRVTPDMLQDVQANRVKTLKERDRFPHRKAGPQVPDPYDVLKHKQIMRPVDPETRALLYSSIEKDGRSKYLKERYKIIPEHRYYMKETTNFQYGWGLMDMTKNLRSERFGKSQIIKNTFYRRNGTHRDPDHYAEPAYPSPTVCNVCRL